VLTDAGADRLRAASRSHTADPRAHVLALQRQRARLLANLLHRLADGAAG
jgi:hypothetical protein